MTTKKDKRKKKIKKQSAWKSDQQDSPKFNSEVVQKKSDYSEAKNFAELIEMKRKDKERIGEKIVIDDWGTFDE